MKKIRKLLLVMTFFITTLTIANTVYASSSSISFSTASPVKGSRLKITISVSNVNTVDLSATISGAGTNASIQIVDGSMTGDAKTFSKSVEVTPTSTGTINVSISSGSNAVLNGEYVDVSGSRSVTVKEASPSNENNSSNNNNNNTNSGSSTNNSSDEDKKEKKSSDNNLASLSISNGELSPEFSADTKSYSVSLTSDISTLKIDAKAKDSKAKVSGTGEQDIKIGSQTFEVIVTAEDGSKKTYAITVDVAEKPTVFTELNNQKLGLLQDVSKVKAPDGYEGVTLQLEGNNIQGWTNEKTGLTLVYLLDEDDNKNFYIYEDGKITGKYETITVLGREYILLSIPSDMEKQTGLKFSKVKLDDLEIDGWKFEDKNHSNYSVVYLMNDSGEKQLYTYEALEGTLQKFVPIEEKDDISILTYVFIGTTVVFVASTAALAYLYINFKKKSISAIKDYYNLKSQDD